jgi:hypothetical protein
VSKLSGLQKALLESLRRRNRPERWTAEGDELFWLMGSIYFSKRTIKALLDRRLIAVQSTNIQGIDTLVVTIDGMRELGEAV